MLGGTERKKRWGKRERRRFGAQDIFLGQEHVQKAGRELAAKGAHRRVGSSPADSQMTRPLRNPVSGSSPPSEPLSLSF